MSFKTRSQLQVEMVKALCDNEHLRGKLFLVGDHKQSIYRFRGGEAEVFRQLPRGDARRGPAAAVAELPQPAGGSRFRQRAVWRGDWGRTTSRFGPAARRSARRRRSSSCGRATPKAARWPARRRSSAEDGTRSTGWAIGVASPLRRSDPMGPRRAAAAARGRLDRPANPQHARLVAKKIVWDNEGRAEARPSRRPAPPAAGDVALLFRALTNVEYYEEALPPPRDRLLSCRRPCLLRPAGNLRSAEPAADAGQSRATR